MGVSLEGRGRGGAWLVLDFFLRSPQSGVRVTVNSSYQSCPVCENVFASFAEANLSWT